MEPPGAEWLPIMCGLFEEVWQIIVLGIGWLLIWWFHSFRLSQRRMNRLNKRSSSSAPA